MRITNYRVNINHETGLNELVKEKAINYNSPYNAINSPMAVFDIMKNVFNLNVRAEEYMYMIAMNNKAKPIAFFQVGQGTVNSCLMPVREIYIRALLSGATQIILVHNHPSGDTAPSREDINATKTAKEAGQLIGVELTDHIIIGYNNYLSLREECLI